jgi:hypothetical protein
MSKSRPIGRLFAYKLPSRFVYNSCLGCLHGLLVIACALSDNNAMTENEQKQQLSFAYVQAVAARAGFACDRPSVDDDSVDLRIAASGSVHGMAIFRSPMIELQMKATSAKEPKSEHLSFALPIKNYDDLRQETMVPRLLVVLLLPERIEEWLDQSEDQMITRRCAYWTSLLGQPESRNSTRVTVSLPRKNQFTVPGLEALMQRAAQRKPL